MKNVRIEKALRAIAEKHHGLLLPEHVVQEAKNPRHPLHNKFEWDNTEAANQHRLWQARQLIRVTVEILGEGLPPSPVFVSLSSDRHIGNGYRVMSTVMSDSESRDQLLSDALRDLNTLQQKYRRLRELAEVFAAVKKVRRKAA